MTAILPIEVQDNTKAGFDSVIDGAQKVDKEIKDLDSSAEYVRKEFEGLENQLKETRDALDKMGKELDDTKRKLDQEGAAAKKAGKETNDSFLNGLITFELLKKGIELAGKGLQAMADNGSPAALRLVDAFGKVQQAALDAAEDPGFQATLEAVADVLENQIVPLINSIPDAITAVQDSVSSIIVSTGEWFGIFDEGASDALQSMQEMDAKQREIDRANIEARRKEFEAKKQQEALDKTLADLEYAQQRDRENASLDQIKSIEEVNKKLEDEIQRVKDLAKEAKLTDQEQKIAQDRFIAFEARKKAIQAETAQAQKEIEDKERKRRQEDNARIDAYIQEEEETRLLALEEEQRLAKEAADKKLKDFEDYVDALEKKYQELNKKDETPAGSLVKSFSQEDITKQVAKTREAETKAQFEQQRQDIKDQGLSPEEQKAELRKLARDEVRTLRDVRRQTFQQGSKGELDVTAVQNATEDLANNAVDQAVAQGNLSQQQGEALKKQAKILAEQKAKAEQLEADVQDINDFLDNIAKPSVRARAQRAGSRN